MLLYLSLAMWIILFGATVPATLRLMRGRAFADDAVKFSYNLISAVLLAFGFRWVFAPESELLLNAARAFSIPIVAFLLAIIRYYRNA